MEHSGSLTGSEISILRLSNNSGGCLSSVNLYTHPRFKAMSQLLPGCYHSHKLAPSDVPQMSPDSSLLMAMARKKLSKSSFLSKRKKLQRLILSMKVQKPMNASVVKPSVLKKSDLAKHTRLQTTDTSPSTGWGNLSRCCDGHL